MRLPEDKDPPYPYSQILLVTLVFAGWFIYASIAVVASGFPTTSYIEGGMWGLLQFEIVAFAVAATILYGYGWRWVHFRIEISLKDTLLGGAVFLLMQLAAFAAVALAGKNVGGADFSEAAAARSSMSLAAILMVSIVNGVYEEFFLCRYLISAFRKHRAAFAIGVSVLVRISYHLYQGPYGAIAVLAIGITLGALYWRYGRIWPLMFGHILADVYALGQIAYR
jgi:uncharacterized protein